MLPLAIQEPTARDSVQPQVAHGGRAGLDPDPPARLLSAGAVACPVETPSPRHTTGGSYGTPGDGAAGKGARTRAECPLRVPLAALVRRSPVPRATAADERVRDSALSAAQSG